MKLIMIGFGTVAQGLSELLLAKNKELLRDHGFECTVVGICDTHKGSAYDPAGLDLEQALSMVADGRSLSDWDGAGRDWDAPTMLAEGEADAMVEASWTDIETGEPATGHIRTALERGVHVATTNKGPLALHARELLALAEKRGVRLLYEGTVMAGTPLLNLVRETLAGCRINEMQGILNGTTNFILTRMEDGMDYAAALDEAQRLGYAEAVPDADVKGWDALAKVTILANVVFGSPLQTTDVPCQGIEEITPEQIEAAGRDGKRYKLIGRVWRDGVAVRASVGPQLVDLGHPLAGVGGATNAVTVSTDALGDVTVVGPGAGRAETGYALLNDLIHIGRRVPATP